MAGKLPPLPPSFTDLATVSSAPVHATFNVIGVVVDYLPPKPTARGEHMLTFKLLDLNLRDAIYDGEGYTVRIFRRLLGDLPLVKGVGDVILMRNAKIIEFAGQRMLGASFTATYLVFAGTSVPDPAFKLDYVSGNSKLPCQGTDGQRNTLSPMEQDYIITLKNALNIHPQLIANAPAPAPAPGPAHGAAGLVTHTKTAEQTISTSAIGKFKLVGDLRHRVFSDICVQVVKKFPNNYGNCELYVTDYTANDAMFYYAPPEEKQNNGRDGDLFAYNAPKRDWPGPYGKLVFKVTLSEPHASFANQKVNEGDILLLQNVKVKLMPNNNLLEGDMWPDQLNKSKVQIQKVPRDHPAEVKLRQRKEKYWTERQAALGQTGKPAQDDESNLTGKQKKNLKKKQRKEEKRKIDEQAVAIAEQKIQANKHVRCSYIDHPLATVSHILDKDNVRHTNTLPDGNTYVLPFINAKYHIKVRVVDFHPPKLEDFAIKLSDTELENDASEFSQEMSWPNLQPCWEWAFALQVEEVSKTNNGATNESQTSRMWLHVGHSEAQFLFGNDVADPTDLRQDSSLLGQLREKLYILWGDLEERKRDEVESEREAKRLKLAGGSEKEAKQQQKPSNLPFNCCLQEYGAMRDGGNPGEVTDWERQYMMFGVVIS